MIDSRARSLLLIHALITSERGISHVERAGQLL